MRGAANPLDSTHPRCLTARLYAAWILSSGQALISRGPFRNRPGSHGFVFGVRPSAQRRTGRCSESHISCSEKDATEEKEERPFQSFPGAWICGCLRYGTMGNIFLRIIAT